MASKSGRSPGLSLTWAYWTTPLPSMTKADHEELSHLMDRLDRKLAALG